ncbi:primase-helicase family protein [Mangrovimonas xylaniphaga]|uniref:primase-helicase family protein n=1 Tax=Mangrovimonas xylaniphaga TaxID=1645915 RepID=UPI0006B5EB0C|nr:primase-helicase family protein [Mangrovimonas xylaniphaga]
MSKYLRIGTDYYKKAQVPLHSGDKYNALLRWKKSEIITDEGKAIIDTIERFDGFCLIPSHTNFQENIEGFYNKYEKVIHEFKLGEFKKTEAFLKHIFGSQYDLGLDYLSILWKKPTQILPILCLVSEERKTGKTTFLNWLKLIFQGNMTINKNEDFRSRFNSDWSSKLIVSVDEVLLDKREDSERIKNLSTANTYKTESKGVDKVEANFFGKFILCSNNEDNFINIDKNEIRYWIRRVPALADENENPDLLKELHKELPYFMHFLNTRKILTKKRTRMWFSKTQIHTAALDRLINGNKTYLHKEISELIMDDFIKYDVDELKYSVGELKDKLANNNLRVNTHKVSTILKDHFELTSTNGSYDFHFLSINPLDNKQMVSSEKRKGRYFTFNKNDYLPALASA